MVMKKTKVMLTEFNEEHTGVPAQIYFEKFLLLRKIRKVGDTEVVNNYQLGLLNQAKKRNCINFIKLK